MALLVQKFGGSSVADLSRVERVARRVSEAVAGGDRVVVVVSAMRGETNHLLQLANELGVSSGRELDVLLSSGEQVTAALLAMSLQKLGFVAKSYCAHQLRLVTTSDHQAARIVSLDSAMLVDDIESGVIPVVAGFQGINKSGDVTTMGRGASDLTAVALAAVLGADECQIFTDVDGVYRADPRIVPGASRIEEIALPLMVDMADAGARVLQPRCLEMAGKYRVPLRVLSSYESGLGTLISHDEVPGHLEHPAVMGIVCDGDRSQISIRGIPDRPGLASYILAAMSGEKICMDMLSQTISESGDGDGRIFTDVSFAVIGSDLTRARAVVDGVYIDLGARDVSQAVGLAKVTLIGVGLQGSPNIVSMACSVLSREGVYIYGMSASSSRVEFLVAQTHSSLATSSLHRRLIDRG